jgi:hypothetical protein
MAHKNKFLSGEEWCSPNGGHTQKSDWRWLCAECDGLGSWNAEVLLEAWRRHRDRGNAHEWIDRLLDRLVTGIS